MKTVKLSVLRKTMYVCVCVCVYVYTYIWLTLEQHGFELCEPTYTQVSFNKYMLQHYTI